MPTVLANGIELAYERAGAADAPTLLLLVGLGGQLCSWDDDFIELFVQRGFAVVRMDHRDTGLSTRWSKAEAQASTAGGKQQGLGALVMAALAGQPVELPYSLADMADDAAALLRALAIPAAHVIGVSMGGMIAQLMALRAPAQVRSLTSIMSTTGERGLPPPEPQALARLVTPLRGSRDELIERLVETFRIIGSPPPLYDAERVRARVTRCYDRSVHPAGLLRHTLAVITAPGRAASLRELRIPTLVIHGDRDPLVPLACGQATAAAIPGARLLTLPGMGHDLPQALWPQIVDTICAHARAAEPSS